MADPELLELARQVGVALHAKRWTLASAESCTGGWIAKTLTDVPGSSAWMDRGVVTYSDRSKQELLGVSAATLRVHGAVSEAVVRAMAEGLRARSGVDVSVAVSGIAGPGGGSLEKPVGTVWLAWSLAAATRAQRVQLPGDREAVRRQAVRAALAGLLNALAGDG
ncbi:MAG: damage-inducible protein CinA [Chromatiales bacterium 21-64-14]|nr:MAG: damage-inducible protein CinA [Chromatiales bacterium 21-64-14]HQU14690.1 CinA family protein [Gammaproteobacteria bacterium]